jgi:tRNA(fMet)-specific endonuclease VapC
MTLKYLLDTNVISEMLRPEPNKGVLEKIRAYRDMVGIAAVVWHELLYGCYRLPESGRRTTVETFLFDVVAPSIPILPYDETAANWHAAERTRLASVGKTPPFVDGQIAAIAKVNDLILVTFNTDDFKGFQDLRVENWQV